MQIFAVIVAAGSGQRFGGDVPKQFCMIGGVAPLLRSVQVFLACDFISGLVCVIPENYLGLYESLTADVNDGRLLSPVFGGRTRQSSVHAGLHAILGCEPDYVLIHDASRCLCNTGLISRVCEKLRDGSEAVIPVMVPVDSVRYNGKNISRDSVGLVQTPQGFKYETIMQLHSKYAREEFTDDASLCDRAGIMVDTVEGERSNIKITYKSDMFPAYYRTGYGYDAHRFSDNSARKLYLMGIEITNSHGLEGVSDADVGIHSVVDAILGALCLGSIGEHFPEHDASNLDVRSTLFLNHCRKLLQNANADIVNIDTTIVCEEPKISSYSADMKQVVAGCLEIDTSIVNIKGKTTEGMGFEGRKEGISATSVVTIRTMQ